MLTYLNLIDTTEDRDKFRHIYEKYSQSMLKTAYSILGDYHEAEDAVQNALFSVARHLNEIKDPDSDRTAGYLMVNAKNAAIDILTKRTKFLELDCEIPDEGGEERLLEQLCVKETFEKVIEIIQNLHPIYRPVLYLHYVENKSAREIADELHRNLKTVQHQLSKGRQLLNKLIEKELTADERS